MWEASSGPAKNKPNNQPNEKSVKDVLVAVGKRDYGWGMEATWNRSGKRICYYPQHPWEQMRAEQLRSEVSCGP